MIVRADFGRGLARQTYSFWKNLQPDVTVVVDMSRAAPDWKQDLDAYPDAIVTTWEGYTAPFDNPDALEALRETDIIYTVETHYDERLQDHPSILHVNPEFFRHQTATQYWYPTSWRTSDLPPGELVPTPIEDDEIALEVAGPGRFLHVGGHSTWGDRNGSRTVHGILQQVRHPWRVQSQDGMRLNPRVMGYVQPMGYVDDHRELYEDCAVLVLPRRYGGQSLQVNEAMSKGLAVVMGDNPPNIDTWPVIPVPTRKAGRVKTPGGILETHMTLAPALAETLRVLADDPEQVERWQARSLMWARDNAWSEWKPRIWKLIHDAVT